MTLKLRLIISSVILILLFLLMAGVNYYGNMKVERENKLAFRLQDETMHLEGLFHGLSEFIIDEGEPLSIKLTKSHIKGFDATHDQLREILESLPDDLATTLTQKTGPRWRKVREGALTFLKDNPWISVDDDKAMLFYGRLSTEAKALLNDVQTISTSVQEHAAATAVKVQNIVRIISTVIIIAITALLFTLYRSIISRITGINTLARHMSDGDLGFSVKNPGKDELGNVAKDLNHATDIIGGMLSDIWEATVKVNETSNNVVSISEEIAVHASDQSGQTDQAAAAIEQMSRSFVDVAKNTASAANSSQEAEALAKEGGDIVTETIAGITMMSESVTQSAHTIEELGTRSKQIGDIIKVINDIADQTNLLALNAAIEAARAGEHGRGFAVVADEVRKLAERTTGATSEISIMIKTIQQKTDRAVGSMQEGTAIAGQGVMMVTKAGEALSKIINSTQNVKAMVEQIAAAAEEQSTTGDVVASNVESVAELARKTSHNAEQAAMSSNSLRDMVKALSGKLGVFQLKPDEISTDEAQSTAKAGTGNSTPSS